MLEKDDVQELPSYNDCRKVGYDIIGYEKKIMHFCADMW